MSPILYRSMRSARIRQLLQCFVTVRAMCLENVLLIPKVCSYMIWTLTSLPLANRAERKYPTGCSVDGKRHGSRSSPYHSINRAPAGAAFMLILYVKKAATVHGTHHLHKCWICMPTTVKAARSYPAAKRTGKLPAQRPTPRLPANTDPSSLKHYTTFTQAILPFYGIFDMLYPDRKD